MINKKFFCRIHNFINSTKKMIVLLIYKTPFYEHQWKAGTYVKVYLKMYKTII